MKFGCLMDEFRSRMDDASPPYRWSDESVAEFINDSYRDACERANLIERETSVSFSAGDWRRNINPAIYDIRSARIGDMPLSRADRHIIPRRSGLPDLFFHGLNSLEISPTPIVSTTVTLQVYRLPTILLNKTDDLEIDDVNREGIIFGALARAFSMNDPDTGDLSRAALFDAKFTVFFGPSKSRNALRQQREKSSPTVKFNYQW